MLIQELLSEPMESIPAIGPDLDPLRSPRLFQECQILDVRLDALRSTAAVLLEQRAAFDWLRGNTGVIVMRGIRDVHWETTGSFPGTLTAWAVVGATVEAGPEGFEVDIGLSPSATLAGTAETIEYYAMDAGIGPIIPDYTEAGNSEIRSTVAAWESVAVPIERSSLVRWTPRAQSLVQVAGVTMPYS